MSRDNVELVRRLYPEDGVDMARLFADRDRARKVWAPLLHPDFESIADPQAPGVHGRQAAQSRVTGIDAFLSAWQDLISPFEILSMTPKELIALRDDRVLVLSEFRAKTKTGGVEMAFGGGTIWTLEGGLVRSLQVFFDRERALGAARLRE